MEQEEKKIELLSEDVQEIFDKIPSWIIRWGISLIFGIILTIIIGSMFFKYPDIITSTVVITTEHPATWVVARSSGKIQKLLVADKQEVQANELLAIIDNSAKYTDVNELKEQLIKLDTFFLNFNPNILFLTEKMYHLGELQDAYSAFYNACKDYKHFFQQDYHNKKIAANSREILAYRGYRQSSEKQEKIQKNNLKLVEKQFERETKLHQSGVISSHEYENSEKLLLIAQQSAEQIRQSISNTDITIEKLKQSSIDLELEYNDQLVKLRANLKSTYEIINSRIIAWELQYLLKSSSQGTLTFIEVWSENQQVVSGDKVFAVVAENQGEIIGKVQLPSMGAGKVKTEQTVNIKLDGYPYMDYGMLPAKVASISLVPNEKVYSVELSLVGLKTLYNKDIAFTGELTGIAEISTDEMSLFIRLVNPLKHFFKKGFK